MNIYDEIRRNATHPTQDELRVLVGNKEKDKVFNATMPMVLWIAKSLSKAASNVEFDDLVQAGAEGLLKAYNSYDLESSATFATWAKLQIKYEILNYIQATKSTVKSPSTHNTSGYEQCSSVNIEVLEFKLTADETPGYDIQPTEMIESIKSSDLRYPECFVLIKCFGIGCEKLTLAEIATIFDMSRQNVSNLKKSGLKKLKNNKQLQKLFKEYEA